MVGAGAAIVGAIGNNERVSSRDRPFGHRGYQRSATGLLGALLACLGLIAVVFALTLFQRHGSTNPAPTVDFKPALVAARQQAAFDVLAPAHLPRGTRATSVEWLAVVGKHRFARWHVGFVTAAGDYIGLEQGTAPASRFIRAHTVANMPGPTVTINGRRWRSMSSIHEVEHALIWTRGGVTTLVTGTAPKEQIVAFARSLR